MTATIDVFRMKPPSAAPTSPVCRRSCRPRAELVGVEAVDDLALADARPQALQSA